MNRHLNQEQEKRPGSLKPGQDLIIAGSIGLTGAALAARAGEKAVRERFSSQYAERILLWIRDFCLRRRQKRSADWREPRIWSRWERAVL